MVPVVHLVTKLLTMFSILKFFNSTLCNQALKSQNKMFCFKLLSRFKLYKLLRNFEMLKNFRLETKKKFRPIVY